MAEQKTSVMFGSTTAQLRDAWRASAPDAPKPKHADIRARIAALRTTDPEGADEAEALLQQMEQAGGSE